MTATLGSDAYALMVENYVACGYQPYLFTIMFEELGLPASVRESRMDTITTGIYAHYVTQVVRRPRSRLTYDRLPIWILIGDLPVYKRARQRLQDVTINDGLHKQGFALQRTPCRDGRTFFEHFRDEGAAYRRRWPEIAHFDVVPITHDVPRVSDYLFKTVARGRVSDDSVLILPRTCQEVGPQHRTARR